MSRRKRDTLPFFPPPWRSKNRKWARRCRADIQPCWMNSDRVDRGVDLAQGLLWCGCVPGIRQERLCQPIAYLVRYERNTEPLGRYSSQWSTADVGRPPAGWRTGVSSSIGLKSRSEGNQAVSEPGSIFRTYGDLEGYTRLPPYRHRSARSGSHVASVAVALRKQAQKSPRRRDQPLVLTAVRVESRLDRMKATLNSQRASSKQPFSMTASKSTSCE